MRVLRIEPGSSGRADSALDCKAISPAHRKVTDFCRLILYPVALLTEVSVQPGYKLFGLLLRPIIN